MAQVKNESPYKTIVIGDDSLTKDQDVIEVSFPEVEGAIGYNLYVSPPFSGGAWSPKKPFRKRLSVFNERMGWLWSDFKFAVRMLVRG